jgi:hypothetical protein
VDHDFRIWQNLHDAFTRIMALTPAGEVCTLWADQICIKQEDEGHDDDKKVQLRQTGEVYTNAQRVLVWLGDPPRVWILTTSPTAWRFSRKWPRRCPAWPRKPDPVSS